MDAFRTTANEPSIPSSTVSAIVKVERLDATLATYMRVNDQRVARMEHQVDRLALRPGRAIDWITLMKLSASLLLMATASVGIITWPQANQYSAVINGKR
jgi:hypothetical protein